MKNYKASQYKKDQRLTVTNEYGIFTENMRVTVVNGNKNSKKEILVKDANDVEGYIKTKYLK